MFHRRPSWLREPQLRIPRYQRRHDEHGPYGGKKRLSGTTNRY